MHAGGVMPDVASVARNTTLAGCNCLVAYAIPVTDYALDVVTTFFGENGQLRV